jgi:3-hydroxyisobutyrate dehydrogenase-like beta-hydroxyacid dehydrogenase
MNTSLKIAIIGATGNVGKRITDEALKRGHRVTGIAPDIGSAPEKNNLTLKTGDLRDPEALAKVLRGHDVVVSCVKYVDSDPHQLNSVWEKMNSCSTRREKAPFRSRTLPSHSSTRSKNQNISGIGLQLLINKLKSLSRYN